MLYRLSKRMSRKFIKRLIIPIIGLIIMTHFLIPIATEMLASLVDLFFSSLLDGVTNVFSNQ